MLNGRAHLCEHCVLDFLQVSDELEGKSASQDVKELLKLLANPHVKVSLASVLHGWICLFCTE